MVNVDVCDSCGKKFHYPAYEMRMIPQTIKQYGKTFTKSLSTRFLDPVCPYCGASVNPSLEEPKLRNNSEDGVKE